MEMQLMDKALKKKIRFLENRGWYKDIKGRYSHQAYYKLTRSIEEVQEMDWDSLRQLENLMRNYL